MTGEGLKSREATVTGRFIEFVENNTSEEELTRLNAVEENKSTSWRILKRTLLPADMVRFGVLKVGDEESRPGYTMRYIEFLRGDNLTVYFTQSINGDGLTERNTDYDAVQVDYDQADFMISELQAMQHRGELVKMKTETPGQI